MPHATTIALRAFTALLAVSSPALAGPPASYDFDFVTIGAPGNPAYDGSFGPGNVGRGSVAYEYRIARTEVTSAQWMEFLNVMAPQSGGPLGFGFPTVSGLIPVGLGQYQLVPGDPNAGLRPVVGITWREAALYCNWLNNGRPALWADIQSGAYDASTFTDNPDGTFNDQATRSPGAQFWIPSLDEWIKAAHYDPDRYGEAQGGWWRYSHTSDEAPIPGPPGAGQTSAGYHTPDFAEFRIPLGAYTGVQSPWGLWDTSGGASEWLEEILPGNHLRRFDGGWAGQIDPELNPFDLVGATGSSFPTARTVVGLRIAGSIPTPGPILMVLALVATGFSTRRRTSNQ